MTASEVAEAVDRLEKAIRAQFPRIRHINVEAEAFSASSGREQKNSFGV